MSELHLELAAVAKELIDENGRDITLRIPSTVLLVPGQPEKGYQAPSDVIFKGVVLDVDQSFISGTELTKDERSILVSGTDMLGNDETLFNKYKVIDTAINYATKSVGVIKPGDDLILLEFIVGQ